MADEPATNGGDTETGSSQDQARKKLIYESNPKHSEPWQIGKKGSLCENDVRPVAAALLSESVFWEGKRYAVRMGKAYCAQEHSPNRWHGYPVGWQAVPPKLAWEWIRNGVLRKHDFKKYWEAH